MTTLDIALLNTCWIWPIIILGLAGIVNFIRGQKMIHTQKGDKGLMLKSYRTVFSTGYDARLKPVSKISGPAAVKEGKALVVSAYIAWGVAAVYCLVVLIIFLFS